MGMWLTLVVPVGGVEFRMRVPFADMLSPWSFVQREESRVLK